MEVRGQLGTGSLHRVDSRGHTQFVRCSGKWLNFSALCVCTHACAHVPAVVLGLMACNFSQLRYN